MNNEERKDRAVAILEDAILAEVIYNADFVIAKDFLNRALMAEWAYGRPFKGDFEGVKGSSPIHSGPYSVLLFAGWKEKVEKALTPSPEFSRFLQEWGEISELVLKARTLIKKGRRPVERKEDARTLENTGTCALCRRNLKRDLDGGLVHHGYIVRGERLGSCRGTGTVPLELSPMGLEVAKQIQELEAAGAKKWLATDHSELVIERYSSLKKNETLYKGQPGFKQVLEERTREFEWRLKTAERNIENLDKEIAEWVPRSLPGILAGFDK